MKLERSDIHTIIKRLEEIQKELNKLLNIVEIYVKRYYDEFDFDTLCFNPHLDHYKLIYDVRTSLEKLINKLKTLEEVYR